MKQRLEGFRSSTSEYLLAREAVAEDLNKLEERLVIACSLDIGMTLGL